MVNKTIISINPYAVVNSQIVVNSHVVDKGLIISEYKGVHQAKRIMMKAGLPMEVINNVLMQDKK